MLRPLPFTSLAFALSFRSTSTAKPPNFFFAHLICSPKSLPCHSSSRIPFLPFCYSSQIGDLVPDDSSKRRPLKPGLYVVGTPIGNLEDITLRALRVLKSADVILSEDTRHSGKLLQHYNISTPLLSYHKFNETQRGHRVLKRLKNSEIVVLISDAGTPGISDPGAELAKLCVEENIPVIPIPGPSAVVAALSASGLATDEFTFVGFLPRHAGSRKDRLAASANEGRTQVFYVPPHKLSQFLEETESLFGDSRQCVMAREMTKIHEEYLEEDKKKLIYACINLRNKQGLVKDWSRGFDLKLETFTKFWRGTLGEAKEQFSHHQPKGEITLLIEGKANCLEEIPSEYVLEHELKSLISNGQSLSAAVKLVAEGNSVRRKTVYALALKKFGNQVEVEVEDNSNQIP